MVMRQKIYSISAAFLLLFLTVFSSFPAFAAGGLEFYTDYPGISVKAGDSQSISMYVSNDSGSAVEASLSILSMPEGWTGYFSGNGSQISRVHVQYILDFVSHNFSFLVSPEDGGSLSSRRLL